MLTQLDVIKTVNAFAVKRPIRAESANAFTEMVAGRVSRGQDAALKSTISLPVDTSAEYFEYW